MSANGKTSTSRIATASGTWSAEPTTFKLTATAVAVRTRRHWYGT
jgi:hypothetical protein